MTLQRVRQRFTSLILNILLAAGTTPVPGFSARRLERTPSSGSLAWLVGMGALLVLLAGCAPAPAAPTPPAATSGPTATSARPALSTAPSPAASPAVPAASPSAVSAASPQAASGTPPFDAAAWQATVAAAKREGKLALGGPPGTAWREALLTFTRDYPEIDVEFFGGSTTDFWPRVDRERAAGQYLWDVQVGGLGPDTFEVRDQGVLDPVRPVLALPEVVDGSKWLGGIDGLFVDKEKQYLLGFLANVQNNIFVNRDLIPVSEIRTARDLLDPKWKGKIGLQEPRRGGAGNAMLAILVKTYGEGFVRDLLTTQQPVVTDDYRQLTEWVVRGRYPIVIGSSLDFLRPFQQEGAGLNVTPLEEPLSVSSGNGGIKLLSRAPHPNAAKLFINWLLTRDVQTKLQQTVAYNSRRLDAPPFDPKAAAAPAKANEYVYDQYEDILAVKQRVVDVSKELLP